jgi:hypothetical protein
MNNQTALYYLLSGQNYYTSLKKKSDYKQLKKEVDKEIEYFFDNRYVRIESWNKIYLKILTAVFSVNLLSRIYERKLFHFHCQYFYKCSRYALSTLFALKTYNKNKKFFNINIESDIFLPELINKINNRVNEFLKNISELDFDKNFIRGNTPIGIELEFSNKGKDAGFFFTPSKDDPLLNFSKYHHYHLMKFMWRFGAYVDSNTPFKQFIKKGGFLEYTFTKPDLSFKPSEPLTYSPNIASELIKEAVKFTPIKPHSLHTTFEITNDYKKLEPISFKDIIFLIITTGHFLKKDESYYESRLTEGNMKEIIDYRERRNYDGWVNTIEYTYMRLSRDFVRKNIYELAILMQISYKNIFSFEYFHTYSNDLIKWAKKPYKIPINLEEKLQKIKIGLDKEVSLTLKYKNSMIKKIKDIYLQNKYNLNL